jgi:hypothetical protein
MRRAPAIAAAGTDRRRTPRIASAAIMSGPPTGAIDQGAGEQPDAQHCGGRGRDEDADLERGRVQRDDRRERKRGARDHGTELRDRLLVPQLHEIGVPPQRRFGHIHRGRSVTHLM